MDIACWCWAAASVAARCPLQDKERNGKSAIRRGSLLLSTLAAPLQLTCYPDCRLSVAAQRRTRQLKVFRSRHAWPRPGHFTTHNECVCALGTRFTVKLTRKVQAVLLFVRSDMLCMWAAACPVNKCRCELRQRIERLPSPAAAGVFTHIRWFRTRAAAAAVRWRGCTAQCIRRLLAGAASLMCRMQRKRSLSVLFRPRLFVLFHSRLFAVLFA